MEGRFFAFNEPVHSDDLRTVGEYAPCVPIRRIDWASHEARRAGDNARIIDAEIDYMMRQK